MQVHVILKIMFIPWNGKYFFLDSVHILIHVVTRDHDPYFCSQTFSGAHCCMLKKNYLVSLHFVLLKHPIIICRSDMASIIIQENIFVLSVITLTFIHAELFDK